MKTDATETLLRPALSRPFDSVTTRRRFLRRSFDTAAITLSTSLGLSACNTAEIDREAATDQANTPPATPLSRSIGTLTPETREQLEATIGELMSANQVPGFAGGLIKGGKLAWTNGFGYADLENQIETDQNTVQNIGSVTKTITATVLFRLLEAEKLGLDDDVQAFVDFPVRNPRHPEVAITIRQLLTHRSSITDGDAYDESYACGDPGIPLGEWLEAYFTAPELENNFHSWPPGTVDPPEEPRAYSNVAYGLLGHVIESVTGSSYSEACRQQLFDPLGMSSSGFWLREMDRLPSEVRHAIPYTRIAQDFDLSAQQIEELLLAESVTAQELVPGALIPHCLYSFATPPDGLLRTNVRDLARFLEMYIDRGQLDGQRLLRQDTLDMALSDQHYGRSLCWSTFDALGGEPFFMHSGGDPGIATMVAFRPKQRSAMILLFNTADPGKAFGGIARAMLAVIDSDSENESDAEAI